MGKLSAAGWYLMVEFSVFELIFWVPHHHLCLQCTIVSSNECYPPSLLFGFHQVDFPPESRRLQFEKEILFDGKLDEF